MTCGNQPLPFNLISMAFTSLSNWILHVVVWLEKYLLLDKRNWPLKKKSHCHLELSIKENMCSVLLYCVLMRVFFVVAGDKRSPQSWSRLLLRTHHVYVVSFRFELPLRMNGMHRTHFDHLRLDLQSLVILSRVFWPSVTWNVRKPQRWSKTFDRYRPHSVTFGYY